MLRVLKAGFFSTIQDNGRFGLLNKGVPVAGVMDSYSATKLNKLLENESNAAVMEITMTGPTIEFLEPTYFCAGGADIMMTLNNNPIQQFTVYQVQKGDILSYGKLVKGFRNYLAVKGGFLTPAIQQSRSYFYPITEHSQLKDGVEIDIDICEDYSPKVTELQIGSFLNENLLAVSKGPEFELLSDRQLEKIFTKSFSIAKEYNRMAYQLEELIEQHKHNMLTSATLPGTIQLTPAGKLIILMKDGQTTGGYPRILQLSDKAISILAQKKYKDQVSFKLV